jgi:hypothetical protein
MGTGTERHTLVLHVKHFWVRNFIPLLLQALLLMQTRK